MVGEDVPRGRGEAGAAVLVEERLEEDGGVAVLGADLRSIFLVFFIVRETTFVRAEAARSEGERSGGL